MGPSYANFFVGYIKNQFFNQFNATKPELYVRYIDNCIGATSCRKEELAQLLSPALKYTWETSKTSIGFLDIKVSINGNGLSTNAHCKPTDSHSYLATFIPSPFLKNSIPFSQFLRLRRLCSDDFDFSNKSEKMCHFFKKRGYPDSVANTAHRRAQHVQVDRQSALKTSPKEKNEMIPFTVTYHPHNLAAKTIILKQAESFHSLR